MQLKSYTRVENLQCIYNSEFNLLQLNMQNAGGSPLISYKGVYMVGERLALLAHT